MSLTELNTLPRPRDVLGTFGIYAHVPFCAHRCWYCDFNAHADLDHLIDTYMGALVRDAREALSAPADADLASRPTVSSVFIGGGTPSLVDARWITALLGELRQSWDLAADVEISIECNPESITAAKLEAYLEAGVNRVSIGVQSTSGDLLRSLGRTHDAPTALDALRLARRSGVDDVNADLIFGVPGELHDTWRRSLDDVIATDPTHVSCYALTYEEGTPLHAWRRLGKVDPVADDETARRWLLADEVLSQGGFVRYEISNWSRPSFEARHNVLYWSCGEYLGIGAGAHSHLATAEGAVRSVTVKAPGRYAEEVMAGRRPARSRDDIDRRTRAAEVIMCGLRLTGGVGETTFAALSGSDLETTFGDELRSAVDDGLLDWDGAVARLTARGTLLADDVLRRVL